MTPYSCWLFLLIALGILNCSKCGEHWKAWDDHVQSRIRRDTSNSWQDLDSNPVCTLTDIMTHDALGRRASNKLLPPGTQGNCGSCWAFAITHAFADHLRILSNPEPNVDFSQDHLTRCNPDANNGNGCCGSDFESALEYLQEKGFASSSCLPYGLQEYLPDVIPGLARIAANSDGANMEYKRANPLSCPATCSDNSQISLRRLSGFSFLITEEEVMAELDNGGPVIAAVRVESGSTLNLLNYRCGVFVGPSVSATVTPGNHAVEIVDYSRSYSGPSYWVVKNTFGPDWGEGGYVRIARGRNQFQDFYTLDIESASNSAQNAPVNMNPASLCGAQPISNIGQNMLVQNAARFGISAIQNRSLIVCSAGSNQAAELELISIINATQQIIQGFILDLDVQARARCNGLRYPAIISYTVMVENNTFSLGDFNYDVQLASSSPKLEIGSYFMLLILAVVSTL